MGIFAMHCIFAFAACMGFAFPLAIAGSEKRAERAEEIKQRLVTANILGTIADLWLILIDAIPIFWLFHFAWNAKTELPEDIKEAKQRWNEDIKEAKQRWNEEPSIRLFFWISVILISMLPLYLLKYV